MTPELKRMVAPVVLLTLLAATTAVAEDKGSIDQEQETVTVGKMLAETATTAAAEDAIKAVLAETRMDLDIRFNGRTSLTTVDGP